MNLSGDYAVEQVVINRQNKQIESCIVGPNPNGTNWCTERLIIRPDMTAKEPATIMDNFVYSPGPAGSLKIDHFKFDCAKIIKALTFSKWDAAEE